MDGVMQKSNLIPFKWVKSLNFLTFAAIVILAGCNQNEPASVSSPQNNNVSFKVPDSILASKLDLVAGTLTATISYGTTTAPMTISSDGLTASATLNNIPVGATDFTLLFTYDLPPFGPLEVASATKNINVTTGNNTLAFAATDYDTASFDEDGDGVSNIEELDEFSTSSPVVALCILDSSQIDDCELGS